MRLRRSGFAVAQHPRDWATAATGGSTVVGARAAAWAPIHPAAIVVVDEHDEAYQEERAPTWNARDVVVERARRAGGRCLLLSPCPSLEVLDRYPLVVPTRTAERTGWPLFFIISALTALPSLVLLVWLQQRGHFTGLAKPTRIVMDD